MTNDAQKHLDKAVKLLAKGDGFYAQAADEIIAAKDSGATWNEIGDSLGRSKSWVTKIAAWGKDPANRGSAPTLPFAEPDRDSPNVRGARTILRDAPLEQVEQMIAELPEDRKLAIAGAAGSGYATERLKENERVKNLTPADKKGIEAAQSAITGSVNKALGGFAALGVVGHIEQATEDLTEMIESNSLTPESIASIDQALTLFQTEMEVARATAGLGEESIA